MILVYSEYWIVIVVEHLFELTYFVVLLLAFAYHNSSFCLLRTFSQLQLLCPRLLVVLDLVLLGHFQGNNFQDRR